MSTGFWNEHGLQRLLHEAARSDRRRQRNAERGQATASAFWAGRRDAIRFALGILLGDDETEAKPFAPGQPPA